MNEEKGIFSKVKAYLNENKKGQCQLMEGILGRFDQELNCYAFYKQDRDKMVESIVYVTQRFFENHQDVKSLEKTVLEYLHQKKGMQATFKTSGIDELPLIKKEDES